MNNTTKGKDAWSRICVVLSVLLAVQLLVAGFARPGWFKPKGGDGEPISTETATVTAENSVVTVNGVTVDANPLNLRDGAQQVTVSDCGRYELGGDPETVCFRYDIEMGEHRQLRAPVTITIPYDKKLAQGKEVVLVHDDPDLGARVPLMTYIDEEAGTASALLGSLSPVDLELCPEASLGSLYTIADAGKPNATVEVSDYYWSVIKSLNREYAEAEAKRYTDDPANYSVELPISSDGEWIQEGFDETNTQMSLFLPLYDVGLEGFNIPGLSKTLTAASFTLMFTQLCLDIKNHGLYSDEAAINLYKNCATNGGSIYSLMTGYSSAAFTLTFLGVTVFGYELDAMVKAAQAEQAENISCVFDYYYEKYAPFDKDYWYNVFTNAYWKYNSGSGIEGTYADADAAMKEVKKAIDDHANKFWEKAADPNDPDFYFVVGEAGRKNFYSATEEQKKLLTEQCKLDLWKRIEKETMPDVQRFLVERIQENVYTVIASTTRPYNEKCKVTVQEVANQHTAELCQFRGYEIAFGNETESGWKKVPDWSKYAPDDEQAGDWWSVETEFTRYAWIKDGKPRSVLLYDGVEDDPARTEAFEPVFNGELTIDLSGAEEKGKTEFVLYQTEETELNFVVTPIYNALKDARLSIKPDHSFELTASSGEYTEFQPKTRVDVNDEGDYYEDESYRKTTLTSLRISGVADYGTLDGSWSIEGSMTERSTADHYEKDYGAGWFDGVSTAIEHEDYNGIMELSGEGLDLEFATVEKSGKLYELITLTGAPTFHRTGHWSSDRKLYIREEVYDEPDEENIDVSDRVGLRITFISTEPLN